jgi:Na+/proline symporter
LVGVTWWTRCGLILGATMDGLAVPHAFAGGGEVGSSASGAHLKVADWVVIGVHLVLTVAIGVVVSLTTKTTDKMTAGRSMNGLVVGLSMLSGLVSGISYVGLPGYALGDGIGVMFLFLGYFLSTPIGVFIILPFYHRLQLTTAYEYLSLRFSKTARIIGSFLFVSRITMYLGVVLYAPALTIQTCTGIPLWASITFTGVVATLWTLKGGMVAVIYTDAAQSIAMIIGVLVCTIVTVTKIPNGFGGVFEALYNHSSNTTNYMPWQGLLSLHPTQTRNPGESFWALLFGTGITSLVQTATDQLAVQRCVDCVGRCVAACVHI